MAVSKHLSPKKCGVVSTPTPPKTDLWVIDRSYEPSYEKMSEAFRTDGLPGKTFRFAVL